MFYTSLIHLERVLLTPPGTTYNIIVWIVRYQTGVDWSTDGTDFDGLTAELGLQDARWTIPIRRGLSASFSFVRKIFVTF